MLNDKTLIKLGELLKQARLNRKLSLRELSMASGIPKSTIARYEAGRDGSIKKLDALCRVLGLDYSELVEMAEQAAYEEELNTYSMQVFHIPPASPAGKRPAAYTTRQVLYDSEHKELIDLYDSLDDAEKASVIALMKVMGGK